MLIWREGLADWQPLSVARPDLVTSSGAPVLGGVAVPEQHKDLLVQQMREGTLLPGAADQAGARYAGFWIRVGAKLLDGLVASIIVGPLLILLFMGMGIFSQDFVRKLNDDDPQAIAAILMGYGAIFLFSLLFQIGYNGIMVWKWGATLGKMAVGVKVVTADGRPLSFGRSIGRAAADMINHFLCSGLPYIMVAIDETEKRGLHDHIAGTRVVFK
jgi:uncharacterized RDD family membrane protein YckC